jgi:transcriptional regulator with XRE-family HTH domain
VTPICSGIMPGRDCCSQRYWSLPHDHDRLPEESPKRATGVNLLLRSPKTTPRLHASIAPVPQPQEPRLAGAFSCREAEMPGKSPDPVDKHVGSRMRMRRLMLDMSQTEVADALGVTFQQVQKYEKGTGGLGASRLQRISKILQVPVAFLFEGVPAGAGESAPVPVAVRDEFDPVPARPSSPPLSFEGLGLLTAFMRIQDPKMRNNIVQLVEEIAFGSPIKQ